MKRLRIIGLALLALFALGAFMASTASAEEGVLPLNVKTFNILGKQAKLLNTAKTEIKCNVLKGEGAFTSDSHGTATLDFLECESGGFIVWSLGEKVPSTIKEALILVPVLFLICLIPKVAGELRFGLFVELKEAVHIDNTSIGILTIVEGAVIGEIETTKGKLFKVAFAGKNGAPAITQCQDEKGGVKKHTLTSTNVTHTEKLTASEETEGVLIQSTEEQELMDK